MEGVCRTAFGHGFPLLLALLGQVGRMFALPPGWTILLIGMNVLRSRRSIFALLLALPQARCSASVNGRQSGPFCRNGLHPGMLKEDIGFNSSLNPQALGLNIPVCLRSGFGRPQLIPTPQGLGCMRSTITGAKLSFPSSSSRKKKKRQFTKRLFLFEPAKLPLQRDALQAWRPVAHCEEVAFCVVAVFSFGTLVVQLCQPARTGAPSVQIWPDWPAGGCQLNVFRNLKA